MNMSHYILCHCVFGVLFSQCTVPPEQHTVYPPTKYNWEFKEVSVYLFLVKIANRCRQKREAQKICLLRYVFLSRLTLTIEGVKNSTKNVHKNALKSIIPTSKLTDHFFRNAPILPLLHLHSGTSLKKSYIFEFQLFLYTIRCQGQS